MKDKGPLACSRDDLLEMVAAMHLMKAPPLRHGQRTQDRMAKYTGVRAESLLSIGEHGIHCDQGVIEPVKRFISQTRLRPGVCWRFNSTWKLADTQHVEAAKVLTCAGA